MIDASGIVLDFSVRLFGNEQFGIHFCTLLSETMYVNQVCTIQHVYL